MAPKFWFNKLNEAALIRVQTARCADSGKLGRSLWHTQIKSFFFQVKMENKPTFKFK